MKTATRPDRRLRGELLTEQAKPKARIVRGWQDHAVVDVWIAGVVVGGGLVASAVFDLWDVVQAPARHQLESVTLAVLGGVTALVLAAVTFAWTLRLRGRVLNTPSGKTKLRDTWTAVLRGTAGGLLVLGVSWAADLGFGWAWTGWLALGAVIVVVMRTARALWLLITLLSFAE